MKALIIDDLHEAIFPILESAGVTWEYRPEIQEDEVYKLIKGYELLILRSKMQLDDAFLRENNHLKIIGRCGAGMDNIDLETAQLLGIQCISANEGNRDAVAEHTIGLILGLLHRITKSNSEIKDLIWQREANRGEELSTKTVGIIGYGNMGKAVAKRLKSFGCRTIAYDKYLENFGDQYVEEVSMEEVFNQSDILSLHIPLNSETKFLVNKFFISKFRKPIYLINTSRGKIVKLSDLILMLDRKQIAGTGLDVLENENLPKLEKKEKEMMMKLNSFENVIITPHVAGWSVESYQKLSEVLGRKIVEMLRKK